MKKRRLSRAELKNFLDEKAQRYNCETFIAADPIVIPHEFNKPQDIEIAGLFAAVLAWGQRVTIIRKCRELMQSMDNDPHNFILHHRDSDLKRFLNFKHRTFNSTDALYFITFLRWYFTRFNSLEHAFYVEGADTVEQGLINFHSLFFSLPEHPPRTKKHLPSPLRKSTCKRLAMYLRWMVRKDNCGVDFGIWKQITPAQLVIPCDVHVDRVARHLKLITRKQTDWLTVMELTKNLRKLDPVDPARYDFALFGIGIDKRWSTKSFH